MVRNAKTSEVSWMRQVTLIHRLTAGEGTLQFHTLTTLDTQKDLDTAEYVYNLVPKWRPEYNSGSTAHVSLWLPVTRTPIEGTNPIMQYATNEKLKSIRITSTKCGINRACKAFWRVVNDAVSSWSDHSLITKNRAVGSHRIGRRRDSLPISDLRYRL